MSGWTKVKEDSVLLTHHSTASVIQITITQDEEVEQGKTEKQTFSIWLEYSTFCDLKNAVNKTDFP
jgi:hypothetical protein